jgi:hypothetical protein
MSAGIVCAVSAAAAGNANALTTPLSAPSPMSRGTVAVPASTTPATMAWVAPARMLDITIT